MLEAEKQPENKIISLEEGVAVVSAKISAEIQANKRPVIVVVYGIPGSGKTFFIRAVSEQLAQQGLIHSIAVHEDPGDIDKSKLSQDIIFLEEAHKPYTFMSGKSALDLFRRDVETGALPSMPIAIVYINNPSISGIQTDALVDININNPGSRTRNR